MTNFSQTKGKLYNNLVMDKVENNVAPNKFDGCTSVK